MLIKLFILSRPLNVFIASLTILIAASLSTQFTFQKEVFYAIASVAFITAAANIVNDILDIEIDKINKPDRLIARGEISLTTAWVAYFILNTSGLFCSALVGEKLFIIAVISVILLFLYSYRFKKQVLIGNLLVSFLSAVAFIYATLSVGDLRAGIIPAIFAFFFHLGREIIKDVEDLGGDLMHNAVTFAGRFGKKRSFILIDIIFLILIGFLVSPDVLNEYNVYYIYIVLLGVIPVLLLVSVIIWFVNDKRSLQRISIFLKLDMIVGLAALYCGVNIIP